VVGHLQAGAAAALVGGWLLIDWECTECQHTSASAGPGRDRQSLANGMLGE
jgi:hypothetical protein